MDGDSNILIVIVIMTLDAMHNYNEKQKGKVEERIDESEISRSHPGIHSIEMVFMQCLCIQKMLQSLRCFHL